MSSGEGTSSGAPTIRDRVSPTRASSSFAPYIVAGRLAATPDLLTRYWMPPGKLSRQFLILDTSLKLVFILEASTHVSLLFFENLLFNLVI